MWRLSTSSDDQDIIQMGLALYQEDPSDRMVNDAQIKNTLAQLRQHPNRGRAVIFEHEQKIAGYAFLISFWSNELGGEICTIDELYIRPTFRGNGFGSTLVEQVLKRRDLWPSLPVAIELEVTPQNTRARDLYFHQGFKVKKNSTLRLEVPRP